MTYNSCLKIPNRNVGMRETRTYCRPFGHLICVRPANVCTPIFICFFFTFSICVVLRVCSGMYAYILAVFTQNKNEKCPKSNWTYVYLPSFIRWRHFQFMIDTWHQFLFSFEFVNNVIVVFGLMNNDDLNVTQIAYCIVYTTPL